MRQQWCLLFFTKNAFLELITNLTFMENLKKKAKKLRRGPLENLCHTKSADYIFGNARTRIIFWWLYFKIWIYKQMPQIL